MGTIEFSQPSSKSTWDSQDFSMVLKWPIFASPPDHDGLIVQDTYATMNRMCRISTMYQWRQCDAQAVKMAHEWRHYWARRRLWKPDSTGGHRTRVAAVTLDNMVECVFAQREDLP